MEKDNIVKKILEDEDFVNSPKYQNSLQKLLAKTDNVLENGAIGKLLLIPAEEVERIYQESIVELRKGMIDDEDRSL